MLKRPGLFACSLTWTYVRSCFVVVHCCIARHMQRFITRTARAFISPIICQGFYFLDWNGQSEINISKKMNKQGNLRQKTLLNLKT